MSGSQIKKSKEKKSLCIINVGHKVGEPLFIDCSDLEDKLNREFIEALKKHDEEKLEMVVKQTIQAYFDGTAQPRFIEIIMTNYLMREEYFKEAKNFEIKNRRLENTITELGYIIDRFTTKETQTKFFRIMQSYLNGEIDEYDLESFENPIWP